MEDLGIVQFNGEDYTIVETFSRGSSLYIALQKAESEDGDEQNVELYRFKEAEDGIEIIPIETELEFEKALEIFMSLQEQEDEEDAVD